MDGDSDYFAERARAEREAAIRTTNDAARDVHLELAGRYDDLAASIAEQMAKVTIPVEPANDLESPADVRSAFSHARPRLTIIAGTRVTAD